MRLMANSAPFYVRWYIGNNTVRIECERLRDAHFAYKKMARECAEAGCSMIELVDNRGTRDYALETLVFD